MNITTLELVKEIKNTTRKKDVFSYNTESLFPKNRGLFEKREKLDNIESRLGPENTRKIFTWCIIVKLVVRA